MRRPGHENCEGCPVCNLTMCPDCDDEGRFCYFDHAAGDDWRRGSVDIPFNRVKPRRKSTDRGSSTTEYALLTAMIAGILLASIGLFQVAGLPMDLKPPASTQPRP
jgi:hypothetical protein